MMNIRGSPAPGVIYLIHINPFLYFRSLVGFAPLHLPMIGYALNFFPGRLSVGYYL